MKITAHSITGFDSERPVPDGWRVDSEQPDRLLPPWSYCQYRRVGYHPQTLVITPFCRLISQRVTTETCLNCNRQLEEKHYPDPSGLPRFKKLSENVQRIPEDVDERPDESDEEFGSRFDLTVIGAAPFRRDRAIRVESDGVIVYEREGEDWEPPRDINGYQRDPDNPWRFIPLWPKCMKRRPTTKRNENCGGVQVTMKCLASGSELNGEEVTHEQCQQCPVRGS